jgi:primosomal protein N' (replication factor Y)
MISIYLKHRKEENVEKMAQWMAGQLKTILGEERVLGPDKPVIARLQNLFIRKLIIKIEVTAPIQEVRKSLCALEKAICTRDRSLIVYCDVDPQ